MSIFTLVENRRRTNTKHQKYPKLQCCILDVELQVSKTTEGLGLKFHFVCVVCEKNEKGSGIFFTSLVLINHKCQ